MEMEYKVEIKDPEFLLLLEINERVEEAIFDIINNDKVGSTNIECLKIDKESIKDLSQDVTSISKEMALNLVKKIDYIIDKEEKEE